MIGKQRKNEITSKSALLEEIKSADFDKVQVWNELTSGQEVTNYMRRNNGMTHGVIVISYRK